MFLSETLLCYHRQLCVGCHSLNKYFGYDVAHIRLYFVFSTTMKGLWCMLGDPEPTHLTLTLENLLETSLSVDWLSKNERTIWACIALAFRSLLRKCNLIPDNLKLEGHFLRRRSFRFHIWGVLLSISSSKTIQFGQTTQSSASDLCTWICTVCSYFIEETLFRMPCFYTGFISIPVGVFWEVCSLNIPGTTQVSKKTFKSFWVWTNQDRVLIP